MFKSFLKIAWRNSKRQKVHTIINVLGLSLGLCGCIVIYVITSYEFSFDNFHPEKERIYRVMGDVTENTGAKLRFGKLPPGVSQNGRSELSGIDVIAGAIPFNATISMPGRDKNKKRFESRTAGTNYITTAIVPPQYFNVFKYKWLAGNPSTALNEPLQVVLTESKAYKYFDSKSSDEIIGKEVIYADSLTVTVSGIVKDWEGNTDLGFTDFISSSSLQTGFLKSRINTDSWEVRSMNAWTFVKLSEGIKPGLIQDQMNRLVKKYAGPEIKLALSLEPLSHMHFNADVIENPIRTANKATLYSLMAIASFILILAIINFINLSTALSIGRAKEVGIRKVLGSGRSSLVFQFMAETFLLTSIAVLLALLLVNPALAAFRSFIPSGVAFHFFKPSTIIFIALVALITTALAGLYPAKILSSYLPVLTLKGLGAQKGGDKWLLRKGLIIFQFAVSLVFIIGSIVITNQLKYTREKDRGFDSDAVVIVSTPGGGISKISVVAEKIKTIPGVKQVALQWLSPMTDNGRAMQLKYKNTDTKEIEVGQVVGNEDFIPLYNIKLLAGRNLLHADSVKEYIINETFLKLMGYKRPGEAIGKTLYWNNKPYPIVGVVADFHTASFHDPISPLCIINRPDRMSSLAIKLATSANNTQSIRSTISQIENEWKQTYPDATFKYQFFEESLALLYKKDQQTAMLMNTAMAITILISSIGLVGLALFTAEKRAKEISIRKLLGATVINITSMLSKDFMVLVLIALCIAAPVAWYFMDQWLQNFAYRINISWWMFVLAGVGTILIALITVGFQAIKAAIANPVKNLRSE